MTRWMVTFPLWVTVFLAGINFSARDFSTTNLRAGEPLDLIEAHLRGGEFAAARQAATGLPDTQRDTALARITQAQRRAGATSAAASTLRAIATPGARAMAMANESYGGSSSPYPDTTSAAAIPSGGGQVSGGQVSGGQGGVGQGGSSFADFDSLMALIQQTVSPDTWDVLGGPSTMSPYPQGIVVDASGTVREIETVAARDRLVDLEHLLRSNAHSQVFDDVARPNQWRLPSEMRVVSLRRMRDEVARRQLVGLPLSDSLVYFAGISEISHVAFIDDDVLVAGVVGGITSNAGWFVDAQTGLHPLRFDFFTTAARSALASQPFGCTIDPSLEGLARAQKIAVDVQTDRLPIGAAASKLAEALGRQRVEVFGTEGDSTIGYLMVEADRHMKRLALGEVDMPDGVSNYLDFIDQMIASGPPAEVLIRLWFTSQPQHIQADPQRQVFRLSGRPLRLSGQNERNVNENRQRVADDPRTVAWVAEFNQRFDQVRTKYPIYGAVESLYRVAACAELIRQFAPNDSVRELMQTTSNLEPDSDARWGGQRFITPTSVDSIAVLHSVRHRNQRHHILLASGGVLLDARQAIDSKVETYATLGNDRVQLERQPHSIDRWWWDATAASSGSAFQPTR